MNLDYDLREQVDVKHTHRWGAHMKHFKHHIVYSVLDARII
jgi:hypothetical protein